MSKRLILVFVGLVMALLLLGPASTARADGGDKSPGPKAKAVLRNLQNNERTELPVKLQARKLADGRNEATYTTEIPTMSLATSGNVKEVARYDPSYSARLTLRQVYWDLWTDPITRYVSVDEYDGKWELLDSSVHLQNAYLQAQCFGRFYTGGFCQRTETKSIGVPALNTWYTYNNFTFSGQYVYVTPDLYQQAGRIAATLVRGGSSWLFSFCVAQGGTSYMTCD